MTERKLDTVEDIKSLIDVIIEKKAKDPAYCDDVEIENLMAFKRSTDNLSAEETAKELKDNILAGVSYPLELTRLIDRHFSEQMATSVGTQTTNPSVAQPRRSSPAPRVSQNNLPENGMTGQMVSVPLNPITTFIDAMSNSFGVAAGTIGGLGTKAVKGTFHAARSALTPDNSPDRSPIIPYQQAIENLRAAADTIPADHWDNRTIKQSIASLGVVEKYDSENPDLKQKQEDAADLLRRVSEKADAYAKSLPAGERNKPLEEIAEMAKKFAESIKKAIDAIVQKVRHGVGMKP